jgi:hypothetical protein
MKTAVSEVLFPVSRCDLVKLDLGSELSHSKATTLVQEPAPLADNGYVAVPADWKTGITCASSLLDLRMWFGYLVYVQSQFEIRSRNLPSDCSLVPTHWEKSGTVRSRQPFQI